MTQPKNPRCRVTDSDSNFNHQSLSDGTTTSKSSSRSRDIRSPSEPSQPSIKAEKRIKTQSKNPTTPPTQIGNPTPAVKISRALYKPSFSPVSLPDPNRITNSKPKISQKPNPTKAKPQIESKF